MQPVCFTSFLFSSLFSIGLRLQPGWYDLFWSATRVSSGWKSPCRLWSSVRNDCMFWLFFVVSEFMFSMKAAIFLSVHVTVECWTCIYSYFLVCFGHFLIQFGFCCLRMRAVLRVLFDRSWNGANITQPRFQNEKHIPMHKCNSTLNTLSSIANQTPSLPLAMRFWSRYFWV